MEKRTIRVSDILKMLEEGKERPVIKQELGLTNAEMKQLFSHPKLKGLKAKKPSSIILVDDLEEETINSYTVAATEVQPVNEEISPIEPTEQDLAVAEEDASQEYEITQKDSEEEIGEETSNGGW